MKCLFWPVSPAVMSRIGRYVLYEVAVLARVAGRYEPVSYTHLTLPTNREV